MPARTPFPAFRLPGAVTLSDGAANDNLSVSGTGCTTLAFGTMSLGANCIGAPPAVLGATGNASTLTLGPRNKHTPTYTSGTKTGFCGQPLPARPTTRHLP